MDFDFVTGDSTGVSMPARPAAMHGDVERFLTDAMRTYGTLSASNRVTRVTRLEPFAGGNSGQKLVMDVEYELDEPGLSRELFAKFSRDFDDPFRDRRRFELEGEIRLADLSRLPEFPVAIPRPCFADFNHETGTGLLITERIAFGEGEIEPLHPKCMDHLLDDPLEYYEAIIEVLAHLAAAHKSGRLSPQVDRLFPYDPATAAADMPIEQDEAGLVSKVRAWARFALDYPQLVPDGLRDPAFHAQLERDVIAFSTNEQAVRRFLHDDPDFIALCHWNSNIDNAWFWRGAAGELHCGLLDWGMVRQMNVGYSLWGGLSASAPDFLARNLDSLLARFAAELADKGGPQLPLDKLGLHFDMSLAILGLSLMIDTPTLAKARLPELGSASSLHDRLLLSEPVVHGFLQVSLNFLHLWRERQLGKSLVQIL